VPITSCVLIKTFKIAQFTRLKFGITVMTLRLIAFFDNFATEPDRAVLKATAQVGSVHLDCGKTIPKRKAKKRGKD
jgi:hypothetical protein